ncbi:MAG: type I-C CRISPR-associated protein Cas8c/Csd1 [Deltaproteobacteria bacterium]|nr:type I-C CRISPR-associated protein Cas8c/Csd1 [Deltaproteobacteria bacterium]
MSWIQRLYETYEHCSTRPPPDIPNPISHTTQMAHIEIIIDGQGNFRRAKVIENKEEQKTLIPCTEESGGRAGIKPKAHPLCDKLQYIAGDFIEYGGKVTSGFAGKPSEPYDDFLDILGRWKKSEFDHPMVAAIYDYLKKGTVIADLISEGVLPTIQNGTTITVTETFEGDKKTAPPIFRALPQGQIPIDAFVRFQVEGDFVESAIWKSSSLRECWISFHNSILKEEGFCLVTGQEKVKLALNHPAKLRHDADKAKLISSNDLTGYTFRGKFLSAGQAAGVSFEVTQEAHSALQWLIRRQAFRSGDQVFVSWATTGKSIPDPCANSWDFLGDDFQTTDTSASQTGDVGQSFALRFKTKLKGYKLNINDTENIVVLGLDSATPGRMAITFYRELTGSEFLERIEKWHTDFAWLQDFGTKQDKGTKEKTRIIFEGAPAPKDIAWCAYGNKVEGKNGIKLLNATVERLMPSIIDGRPVPRDLVEQCVRRASNRVALEPWEFEKCLGITCALYKGFYNERGYKMALEEERCSRDYLYGRLLAVADQIESKALQLANENRGTTASRLMQRFSDRPFSTWKNIEEALKPYEDRIRARYSGLLDGYKELLDVIHSKIISANYITDARLTGEYLLGYHCQRQWFREHRREKGQWVSKTAADKDNQETDSEE